MRLKRPGRDARPLFLWVKSDTLRTGFSTEKGEDMKKTAKYLVAVFVAALLGVMLAGCSGQQASSSASASSEAAPTLEELIAELESVKTEQDFNSVTMNLDGSMGIDMDAMVAAMMASDESADASAASEEASAESADASAASEEASGESSMTEIPIKATAKFDMSDKSTVKGMVATEAMGFSVDIYINGDEAIVAMGDQAYSATLEELNMEQYKDPSTFASSQGADVSRIKESAASIEKTAEGDGFVYDVVCDPDKYMAASGTDMATLAQFGDAVKIDHVNLKFHVDGENKLTAVDTDFGGTGIMMNVAVTISDVDSTEVPEAPEPTGSYSELLEQLGGSTDGAIDEAAEALDQAA